MVVFLWTHSSKSTSFLHWGAESCNQGLAGGRNDLPQRAGSTLPNAVHVASLAVFAASMDHDQLVHYDPASTDAWGYSSPGAGHCTSFY